MFEVKGEYGEAKIFADTVEDTAMSQIYDILNHPVSRGAHTRIMADTHAGKGCVIGYTAKVTDRIIPNLIGVDIGCGVTAVRLNKDREITDFQAFDTHVRQSVPMGREVHSDFNYDHQLMYQQEDRATRRGVSTALGYQVASSLFNLMLERTGQNREKVLLALGTLGGGNHFIELSEDNEGRQWLIVHSGSRNFGYRVADYWQQVAEDRMFNGDPEEYAAAVEEIKSKYKGKEIERRIKALRSERQEFKWSKDLAYLESPADMNGYLQDMYIATKYAEINRKMILRQILCGLDARVRLEDAVDKIIVSTHNYIGDDNIIRKGAISAYSGESVIIPLNMRDGCIVGVGKGNTDYNYSAPHGAGRTMSRSEAKRKLSLEDFQETMSGVYSTSVHEGTLDEAPSAYKPMQEILDNIRDTVEVSEILTPIWNIKA